MGSLLISDAFAIGKNRVYCSPGCVRYEEPCRAVIKLHAGSRAYDPDLNIALPSIALFVLNLVM